MYKSGEKAIVVVLIKYKSWLEGFWQPAQKVKRFALVIKEENMLALSIKQDVPGLSQLALVSVACSVGRQLNRAILTY